MKRKKFFIVSLIFSILGAAVISVLFLVLFIKPGLNLSKSYNDTIISYENTKYEYIVYSPIDKQISEMELEKSIEKVFDYYNYSASISNENSKECETRAIFSENSENLSISSFNESLLISGKIDVSPNSILIDETCSKKLGLHVGSPVNLSVRNTNLDFIVRGIFQDNKFYDTSSIYFSLTDDLTKELTKKSELSLYGALISTNNRDEAFEYLKSYVPMGKMLNREYFSSNSEYTEYINNFMKTDYSSNIYNKYDVLEQIKNNDIYNNKLSDSYKMLIYGAVFYIIAILLLVIKIFFAFSFSEKNTKSTQTIIKTVDFRVAFNCINILSLISSSLILIFWYLINIKKPFRTYYGDYNNIISVTFIISIIIGFALLSIVDNLLIGKINNKKY